MRKRTSTEQANALEHVHHSVHRSSVGPAQNPFELCVRRSAVCATVPTQVQSIAVFGIRSVIRRKAAL